MLKKSSHEDKMKKINKMGFSVVEGLLILVIIGIIGGAGFYVYNANKKTNESLDNTGNSEVANHENKPEDSNKEKDPYEGWKTYKNEAYGYEFKYPKTWQTSDAAAQRSTTPGQPNRHSVTLESPGFAASNEGVGYHLTGGAEMYAYVNDTEQPTAEAYIKSHQFLSRVLEGWDSLTVAGQPAVKYKLHYEGSPFLETLVVQNGKVYAIHFEYANDTALGEYAEDYEALVKSFRFLN